ncbi:hypothetical protein CFBP6773_00067 [Xanthomonas arboricola pv. fragariae]|nr:hypothetical protein CFBP6773_00067 [Xanthomonas arboricola pv. fragariae]
MRTLCCGKATPHGHAHCMPIAICAEWLREYAASRIAGPPWCDRNAAGRRRRAPGSGAHRNCDVRRIARASSKRNARRSTAPAIATVLLRDQRARTCKSHLVRSRNLGTCHVQRALGVGGVMLSAAGSQCTCCNKKIGLRLRWMQHAVCNRRWMSSVTRGRTWRMAKKTVAAATAATTVIDLPARLTWSRGGRTCSESTSAACRCRPCPAAR